MQIGCQVETMDLDQSSDTDAANIRGARQCIAHLSKSERGQACLERLAVFLREDATYSLDSSNQTSVTFLVCAALRTPSVRDLLP